MDQKMAFWEVSADELRAVEGGSICSWLSSAYHWVRDHIGLGGKDMSGNSAVVVSGKGTF